MKAFFNRKWSQFRVLFIAIVAFVIIIFLFAANVIPIPFLPRTLRCYSPEINPDEAYYIQPLGNIDSETVSFIKDFLARDSGRSVVVLDPVPIPDEAWGRRKQANADVLFSYLRQNLENHENVFRLIGVTMDDIYVEDMNFIFGLSGICQKCVIISFNRLKPKNEIATFEELEGRALSLYCTRIRKILRHEIGHTFGLWHCSNPFCVMSYADSVREQDSEGEFFCPMCSQNIRIFSKTNE